VSEVIGKEGKGKGGKWALGLGATPHPHLGDMGTREQGGWNGPWGWGRPTQEIGTGKLGLRSDIISMIVTGFISLHLSLFIRY
jgi:hypothetical protein